MRRPVRTAGAAALALVLCLVTPGGATPAPAEADAPPAATTAATTAAGHGGASDGFPGDAWERADPATLGFDPDVLAEKVEQAGATGASCFAVVRRGRLAGEWYWGGTDPSAPQPVFSVTKSVASTLVGLAQADGLLDIDDPMSDYIPAWRETFSEDVTIRHVLSNTSGRHWDYLTDYPALTEAGDANELALGVGQDGPPGTEWVYNNAAIQALDIVLSQAIGGDVAAYAEERLFAPLGMEDTRMVHDEAGNTRLNVGMESTCRDLARFGLLFLHRGAWAGEQVVPEAWVRLATGRSSQRLNAAYGLLWWLNRPGTVVANGGVVDDRGPERAEGDRLAPGAPRDMFWAIGMGDQLVQVDPGSDTVLVRLAPDDPESGSFYPVSLGAAVIEDALVDASADGERRLP